MDDYPEDFLGPTGEDWRVPVSELSSRQDCLVKALQTENYAAVLIQNPVDLYYFTGTRQNASFYCTKDGDRRLYVRRSLSRAIHESGGDDAPHEVVPFPRSKEFSSNLPHKPALQFGAIPHQFGAWFSQLLGTDSDCTSLVHRLRETKSDWEISMMKEAARIQSLMFDAVEQTGKEGITELELVAEAEKVSRELGFGGNVQMRRFPLQCDRGVIVAGRNGGIPSFFDSAVGGSGPHPQSSMGSGFQKIKRNEPVLVDLVHMHRGYVIDATRMFALGGLSSDWEEKLNHMKEISDAVVSSLGGGISCSDTWITGYNLAEEYGYGGNLMGIQPDQSKFLGHSVGLELDESPVVAHGFDRPLPLGGTMAIEPKLIYANGSIGLEDTWVRTEDGMEQLSTSGHADTVRCF